MAITFYDLEEAKEYLLEKQKEGYEIRMVHQGDKYIVYLGKKSRVKTAGFHWYDKQTGEHIFITPPGASTTTRLHELGHAALGHTEPPKTLEELTERELGAELYAYEKMGRSLTNRTISQIAVSIMKDYELRPNQAFTIMEKAMEKEGYEMSRKGRSELWWLLRDTYEEREKD